MAENKNRVQAGRLLSNNEGVMVYELSTAAGQWARVASVEQATAAFSYSGVALRVVHGPDNYEGESVRVSQVVLSRADFLTLLASYRAFERLEKKGAASSAPASDDFDPFLDPDEMP